MSGSYEAKEGQPIIPLVFDFGHAAREKPQDDSNKSQAHGCGAGGHHGGDPAVVDVRLLVLNLC